MVQQYVFTVASLSTTVWKALAQYPGVTLRGKAITAPANVAWLVEETLQAAGVRYNAVVRNNPKPCPDLSTLPGVREWVPAFLTAYQREGLAQMYGRSGLFLWAAGCLAGDTEVVVNRGGAAKRMLLRDLVHKFNGGRSIGGKAWDLTIPTYVQSFDEAKGVIVKNQVTAAVASGVKRTIWMQTFSGKEIRATTDHRFLTPTGWKKLGELREGDEVLVEKWPEAGGKRGKKPQYKYVDHMWNHPHAVRKVWERKDREEGALRRTAQVALHRLEAEAFLNRMSLEEWVGLIVLGRASDRQFIPPFMHVHHLDGDTSNNHVLNLKLLTEEEHHQLHAAEGGWKRVMAKAVPDRIKYIVGHGEEETFDLSMAAPHHNFIANGIVVHNSGKTIGSVMWALGKGATVVVTRAAVRRQYGREIERITTHRAYVIEDTGPLDEDRLNESMFAVLGWETLPHHLDALLAWKPGAVIFDECFPAGTQVHTDRGLVTIENILPGNRVLSVDAQGQECYRPVVRVIAKRRETQLVRVKHAQGELVCTENHKVWTLEDGYVPARGLKSHHHLRVVPEGARDTEGRDRAPSTVLRPVLFSKVAQCAAGEQGGIAAWWAHWSSAGTSASVARPRDTAEAQRSNEGAQSDVGPRSAGARRRQQTGQAVPGAPWWERAWTHSLASVGLGVVSFFGGRVFDWGARSSADGQRGTAVLTRLGGPDTEAGDRDRWSITSDQSGEAAGCAEGCDPVFSRVEGVAVVERGSDGGADIGDEEGRVVFDLEVEDTHRYFAGGVLVSNCHKAKSNKRFEATPREDGSLAFKARDNIAYAAYRLSRAVKWRLGATATPIKDRTRDLWAQLDLVEPDAWGRFYNREGSSFTSRYCEARLNPFGGIDTTGASNLDELWNRVSISAHHVPHSVTHRDLPPRRRVVTYVPRSEQSAPSGGFAKELAAASKTGKTAILEVRLAEAASRKRAAVVERVAECVEGGQKVLVFTGRRHDCDKLTAAIRKELGEKARVYSGHGGTPAKERDGIQQAYMADPGPCVLVGTGDAWGECLDPDTMILGANKALRECVEGDQVFGESGVSANIGATVHPYTGHMVEIKAQGLLPIRSTTGHATLTMTGGVTRGRDRHFEFCSGRAWKNAEDVKPWTPTPQRPTDASGDFLLIPRLPGTYESVSYKLRRKTDSGWVEGAHPRGWPTHITLDHDFAWLLGLYAAEGSTTIQKNGQARVTFSLNANETELAKQIINILTPLGFTVKARVQKTWMHVEVKSTPLGHLLIGLFGEGAHNKKIPDEVLLNKDMEILRSFLRGYEEGDGHTMEGGRKVQAGTVSKVLALQLQLALARFGRLASISVVDRKGGSIEGRKIKSGTIYIVTWRWESARHDRYRVLDNYIATPVKSVTITPFSGEVGYLSTDDKTMLASNAVVHNGVNLQDTDTFLVVMLPFTPGQIVQWEGRVARHGQKRPVLIEYLLAEGTVDEHVGQVLLEKLPAVEEVAKDDSVTGFADGLQGFGKSEDEIIDSVFAMLGV